MLQSEAGYIDARPHVRQIDETLLQRTAGPYIGFIFVRPTRSRRSRHVRFAPIASEPSHRSERREVPYLHNWRPEQVQQSSASSRSSPPGSQSAADEPAISAITSRWLVRQGAPAFQLGPWLLSNRPCQSQGAGISAVLSQGAPDSSCGE